MLKRCGNYLRLSLFLTIAFVLLGCTGLNPAFADTGKAYILIGDVEPPWYSTLIRSVTGTVDIRKDLDPVVKAQEKKLRDMGYDVKIIETAITSDVEKILTDPDTKAMAWFGHGDPNVSGTISTYDGDITPGDIKEWAQDKLAEKIGRPDEWKSLSPEERRDRYNQWTDAHSNLKYAYFHTCYSLAKNDLADALMDDNGKFYGYVDKAYLNDESTLASKVRGKDVTEGDNSSETDSGASGSEISGGPGSGIYPNEPFNGMQIRYNISGVAISGSNDSHGFTTSRTLKGELDSGQLVVSGSGQMLGGYGADLLVSVSVDGGEAKDFKAYLKNNYPQITTQPFSVTVPIPSGAGYANISIQMTGYYNAGERGLVVSGSFNGNSEKNSGYGEENYTDGYATDTNEIGVFIDGTKIDFDVAPVIEDGRTLVPIRKIVESLGGQVDWDSTGYIRITDKNDHYIVLIPDSDVALVDYQHVNLDVPARIIDGRTMVPLRFLGEAFGLKIDWDANKKTVAIKS